METVPETHGSAVANMEVTDGLVECGGCHRRIHKFGLGRHHAACKPYQRAARAEAKAQRDRERGANAGNASVRRALNASKPVRRDDRMASGNNPSAKHGPVHAGKNAPARTRNGHGATASARVIIGRGAGDILIKTGSTILQGKVAARFEDRHGESWLLIRHLKRHRPVF